MQIAAPFIIDATQDAEHGWLGRVRVDGHVLFLCAGSPTPEEAVDQARADLATHLQMLFTGAADVEHQQQSERYGTLVELAAAQVLRQAAGWTLVTARFQDDQIVAVFQRDWPSSTDGDEGGSPG